MDKLYKKASKRKLRFDTPKGLASIEDLWDIPLTSRNGASVDDIAKALSKELKDNEEESFVLPITKRKTITELKFEIVKDIIKTRLNDKHIMETAALRKLNKEKILGIISDKEDEKLKRTSVSTLKKMVEEL